MALHPVLVQLNSVLMWGLFWNWDNLIKCLCELNVSALTIVSEDKPCLSCLNRSFQHMLRCCEVSCCTPAAGLDQHWPALYLPPACRCLKLSCQYIEEDTRGSRVKLSSQSRLTEGLNIYLCFLSWDSVANTEKSNLNLVAVRQFICFSGSWNPSHWLCWLDLCWLYGEFRHLTLNPVAPAEASSNIWVSIRCLKHPYRPAWFVKGTMALCSNTWNPERIVKNISMSTYTYRQAIKLSVLLIYRHLHVDA